MTCPPPPKKLGWTSYLNKQDWKAARQAFTVTASSVPAVVNYGGNTSRNQALRTAAISQMIHKHPDQASTWEPYLPKHTAFAQRIMDAGSSNEAWIHQQVNPRIPSTITIVPHPALPWLACSPDALDVERKVGHEYKTRVMKKVLPTNPTQIDPAHYLQVQTSMHCTAATPDLGITHWTLSYNVLGEPRISQFFIKYDSELMKTLEIQLSQFNNRVQCIVYGLESLADNDTLITVDDVLRAWKFDSKRKVESMALTHMIDDSIKNNVYNYGILDGMNELV